MLDRIVRLYEERFGARPAAVVDVAAHGSHRRYHRLVAADGATAIGAHGPEPEENRAFLSFSRAFRAIDLPVPEIYADDEPHGIWLMEDLGDTTLFEALDRARAEGGGRFPAEIHAAYRRVLDVLPRFQVEGGRVFDDTIAYPRAAFDRQSILWDLNYFKYHFLKLAGIPFHEARLERDFEALADFLARAPAEHFLYRDFQSRNVMLRDGAPWFVDYQGGRRGALAYDVASLLYDAKADVPPEARAELLDHYLAALARVTPVDEEAFRAQYPAFVLVRILQALGTYGYRGFFERKPRFLQSVPYAARNVAGLLEAGLPIPLPAIEAALGRIVATHAPRPGDVAEPAADGALVVDVSSFAYKGGYPADDSGHGGGFVFDCRAIPNPGRLDAYKSLCGRDVAVVDWLAGREGFEAFWESTRALVDAQVAAYRARGFTHLAVAYGCTGGRHRSVALAERLARHLRAAHPDVRVRLAHREEASWTP